MLRLAAVPTLFLACAVASCVDDSSTSASLPAPTMLTVDPSTFLGSVRCGSDVRKYVVTVTDVTVGEAPMPPSPVSSTPSDCTQPTSFGVPPLGLLHFYIAQIDGYDRDDIVPQTEGGSAMIDPATTAVVLPRWTTTCGALQRTSDGGTDASVNPLRFPTETLGQVEVIFHGCLPFQPFEAPDGGPDGSPPGDPTDASGDAAGDAFLGDAEGSESGTSR